MWLSRGLPAPGPPGIFENERRVGSGGCEGVLVFYLQGWDDGFDNGAEMAGGRFTGVWAVVVMVALLGCSPKPQVYEGPPVTTIAVHKAARQMDLFAGDVLVRRYRVDLGFAPEGHKQFEGDGRTPEGIYRITHRNPASAYHLSLGISYPNESDRALASALGRPVGKDIFIHGQAGKDQGKRDWTAGCIAVRDHEIEEIYAMVAPGTPVLIRP